MSILIKGMEKPIRCAECLCADDESRFCKAAKKYIPMLGKPNWCPLVEIPKHGSLSPISAEEYTNAVGEFLDEVKMEGEKE